MPAPTLPARRNAPKSGLFGLLCFLLDYEAYCLAETKKYISEMLPPEEYRHMFQQHAGCNRSLLKHLTDEQLNELTEGTVRAEIQRSGRVPLLSFEEFGRKRNERAA